MAKKYFCPMCGKELEMETEEGLKDEYPFVCRDCDANFYRIEAIEKEV